MIKHGLLFCRDGELSQVAFVTFKEEQALETALLLSVSEQSAALESYSGMSGLSSVCSLDGDQVI